MELRIDGSHGEGGGQIVRTALALAGILQQPIEIHHIRGGRRKPGLRPQHLIAVKALTTITQGRVEGAKIGSTRLSFEPKGFVAGDFTFDVGTAGSAGLVLQTMIPALLFSDQPSRVVITGGTHVSWSPCFHYLDEAFIPVLRQMGVRAELTLQRWGWYPKGGGKVVASVSPFSRLQSVDLVKRGDLEGLFLLSAISNLPAHIGVRQRDESLRRLNGRGYDVERIDVVEGPSPGTGTAVFLGARFENGRGGFTSLGKKGKPAERVAREACFDFLTYADSGAAIDRHLADQLLLYMALAKGRSSFRTDAITGHLLTNIWVIEQCLPVRFQVDEDRTTVTVEGVGFTSDGL